MCSSDLFSDLCSILGLQDLPDQEAYSRNASRVTNRQALTALLGGRIAAMNSDELMEAIRLKKIPAGPVRNLREVFTDAEDADFLLRSGGLKGVRNFIASLGGGSTSVQLSPPPHLGEHTVEVLGSLS